MSLDKPIGCAWMLALLLGGFFLFIWNCAGVTAPFELPAILAFGWVRYLGRVLPLVNPDPWAVGTAVVCLAAFTLGTHAFLKWLYAATFPEPRRWERRWTGLLVGLIVLTFTAGIAFVGIIHQTAWIVRSPEPLLKGGVRVASARTTSSNNLKQMIIAAHNHQDVSNPERLPRSTFDANGRTMHSWQTATLPFIEQDQLFRQIDRTKPWTDPANAEPMGTRIRVFLHPSYDEQRVNSYGVSHYAGNAVVLLCDTPRTLESFSAGTSNTILAGEVSGNFRAWGDPLNVRDPRFGGHGHPLGYGGPNGRPALFAMLDGSVRTFDPKELVDLIGKVPE